MVILLSNFQFQFQFINIHFPFYFLIAASLNSPSLNLTNNSLLNLLISNLGIYHGHQVVSCLYFFIIMFRFFMTSYFFCKIIDHSVHISLSVVPVIYYPIVPEIPVR